MAASSNSSQIASWLVAGGGGTVLGSLVMTAIQTFGKRGRDRAEAADLTTSAGVRVIERLERENAKLWEANERKTKAIIAITEILDSVINDLPVDNPAKAKLRRVNKEAKLAAL